MCFHGIRSVFSDFKSIKKGFVWLFFVIMVVTQTNVLYHCESYHLHINKNVLVALEEMEVAVKWKQGLSF